MPIVPTSAIVIAPDRQRREFLPERIAELADSIRMRGLLQPIVVRSHPIDGTSFVLVAGERRLRAIETLATFEEPYLHSSSWVLPTEVPVIDIGDLSPLEAEEAELDENLRRVNLTWQEEVAAIARIHELRKAQSPKQTRQETGVELYPDVHPARAQAIVAESFRLAAAMADPDVARAKTRNEALKILGKKDDQAVRTRLSAAAGAITASDRHTIILGKAQDFLGSCPSGSFDAIIIDPPYGMGADSFGDAAGRLAGTTHEYIDDAESTRQLLAAVIPELFRVSKPSSHLYLWCDIDLFAWLRAECRAAGWDVFRTPLVNVKREGGRVPWPEYGPRRCYELCLYAVRGKRAVSAILPDVFESTLSEGNFGHGAQKPVEAYVELLRRSCRPGDRVLDCFAGSGTLLEAAEQLQLKSTLVELAPHAHGIILERLAKLTEKL